jgi:hypothetical protein
MPYKLNAQLIQVNTISTRCTAPEVRVDLYICRTEQSRRGRSINGGALITRTNLHRTDDQADECCPERAIESRDVSVNGQTRGNREGDHSCAEQWVFSQVHKATGLIYGMLHEVDTVLTSGGSKLTSTRSKGKQCSARERSCRRHQRRCLNGMGAPVRLPVGQAS